MSKQGKVGAHLATAAFSAWTIGIRDRRWIGAEQGPPAARLTRVAAAVMFHHEDRRKTMQRLEPGTRPRALTTTTTTARATTDGATKSYKEGCLKM